MAGEKILIVDDKKEIAELIRDYLENEEYEVELAYNGQEALELFQQFKPDLMILDIMLPVIDGLEVCRIIRSHSSVPIIMLSAKKSDIDKILGLGLGADDYVTKPFSPSELVARVKAQLRRYLQFSEAHHNQDQLVYPPLKINLKSYTVYLEDEKLNLSTKEFEILKLLALHPNQVFTREQILDKVWSYNDYADLHTVTVYIRNIRKKLEKNPQAAEFIQTVWGVGYKFEGGQS